MKKMKTNVEPCEIYEVINSIQDIETTIFAGKEFATEPKEEKYWYDKLCSLSESNEIGHDMLCNTFYDCEHGAIMSGKSLYIGRECNKYISYMPTDVLFSIVKELVLKESTFTFTFNDSHSLSGALHLEQKVKKIHHLPTES